MFLSILNSNNELVKVAYVNELLGLNEKIKKYGLILTEEDAKQIIDARSQVLKNYERIELGFNVTKRILELFSSSPYVDDKNYINIITEIQEIFYYYKGETSESIGDEELINIINRYFNIECKGAIQLLKSKMDEYAKEVRIKYIDKEIMNPGRDIYERRYK